MPDPAPLLTFSFYLYYTLHKHSFFYHSLTHFVSPILFQSCHHCVTIKINRFKSFHFYFNDYRIGFAEKICLQLKLY